MKTAEAKLNRRRFLIGSGSTFGLLWAASWGLESGPSSERLRSMERPAPSRAFTATAVGKIDLRGGSE